MNKNESVFELLEREFCPPLDSSLVAAIVADLDSSESGSAQHSNPKLSELRATLNELAAQADVVTNSFSEFHSSESSPTESSSTSCFLREGDADYATSPSSFSSSTCDSPLYRQAFSSPLGFLQAALPHVPVDTLRAALKDASGNKDEDEVDMWDVVTRILTAEASREMDERGLENPGGLSSLCHDGDPLQSVGTKKTTQTAATRKRKRATTLILGDIRQQHLLPHIHSADRVSWTPSASIPDPWTQLFSLSTHLAALLPPHPPSFFQSYFHSPLHSTPYLALRSCLVSISEASNEGDDEQHTKALLLLLDILLPSYPSHNHLVADTELALRATRGDGDAALDLARVLRDLDADSSGYREMGVFHSPPTPISAVNNQRVQQTSFSACPSLISSPSQPPIRPKPPPNTADDGWRTIPKRPAKGGMHSLAAHIPAYARGLSDSGGGKSARNTSKKSDIDELGRGGATTEQRRRIGRMLQDRNDMLRQATWMWRRGNANNRGGEVALHFAERARELHESARQESLEVARDMIESRRCVASDRSTIDLHGVSTAEAVVLVREILAAEGTSHATPLKIITGRGKHSVGQVSVLKPAIRKALGEDGWVVVPWDGGLLVKGRQ